MLLESRYLLGSRMSGDGDLIYGGLGMELRDVSTARHSWLVSNLQLMDNEFSFALPF